MDFLECMYRASRKRAACLDDGYRIGSNSRDPLPDALQKRPGMGTPRLGIRERRPGRAGMPVRELRPVLRNMAVIAEVKYATPAEGDLGITLSPSELAAQYESLGAAAVSCLTEPCFFRGSLDHLSQVRAACSLPVIMKDFIADERQIAAGRAAGADAVLLITEMLSSAELRRLFECARSLGMDCLVEVHGPEGLEKAMSAGARIIGVNARDLTTLKVDPARHEEMASLLPPGVARVAESGVTSSRRLGELRSLGYDAALIGRAMGAEHTRREIFGCG